MDNFMDKITQKITASDLIKANTIAEAEQSQAYQHQMEEQCKELQELLQKVSEEIAKNNEFTHTEGVKVYRNVQAVVEKQSDKMQESMAALLEQNKKDVVQATKKAVLPVKVWLILLMLLSCLHLIFDLVQYLGIL